MCKMLTFMLAKSLHPSLSFSHSLFLSPHPQHAHTTHCIAADQSSVSPEEGPESSRPQWTPDACCISPSAAKEAAVKITVPKKYSIVMTLVKFMY